MAVESTTTKRSENNQNPSFDSRSTLSRLEAQQVYDGFAKKSNEKDEAIGGNDVGSGYGGPAITALLKMAKFESAKTVMDYGCGQGKLAELVLSSPDYKKSIIQWIAIDQSPLMVERFEKRCVQKFNNDDCSCSIQYLQSGDPSQVILPKTQQQQQQQQCVDRFVSTYCLDLLSEDDMYKVLDLAETVLCPKDGLLLLAGITWGYKDSVKTFITTAIWECMYRIRRDVVGGCRPQNLIPYLQAKGWEIVDTARTLPNGYPWMVSEVIVARPPCKNNIINE